MSAFAQFQEDFPLFLEAGFIAANNADKESAIKLFQAAGTLQENHVMSKIGLGYLYFTTLELQKAVAYFQEALDMDPNNELAQALMHFCVGLKTPQNLPTAKEAVENLQESSTDEETKILTKHILNIFQPMLVPSPMELQQEEAKKKNIKKKELPSSSKTKNISKEKKKPSQ